MLHYLDDLDSKMESMRDLIENDRQVEGCFTAYNVALERSVLKKDLFLNPPELPKESPPVALAAPPPAAPPPAAAAPNGAPKSDSPFADKLKQALQPLGSSEGS